MKWEKVVLLLLDPKDAIIRMDANAWKQRYAIPAHLCFSVGPAPGYVPLVGNCLNIVDENTKVIAVSHGGPNGPRFDGVRYGAEAFAEWLQEYGLRRAGLLALKGCLLGSDMFLDNLAKSLLRRDIRVDWLLGYRQVAMQIHPLTSHEGIGTKDIALRLLTGGLAKRSDAHRIKVVRGHPAAAPNEGSRRYR
jgi:hypothetical protein